MCYFVLKQDLNLVVQAGPILWQSCLSFLFCLLRLVADWSPVWITEKSLLHWLSKHFRRTIICIVLHNLVRSVLDPEEWRLLVVTKYVPHHTKWLHVCNFYLLLNFKHVLIFSPEKLFITFEVAGHSGIQSSYLDDRITLIQEFNTNLDNKAVVFLRIRKGKGNTILK